MDLDKAQKAYMNDPVYSNLVETLMGLIKRLQMSPSEIREAAMFACFKLEQISGTPFFTIKTPEDLEAFKLFTHLGERNDP